MSRSVADITCLRPSPHASSDIREWVEVLCLAGVILAGLGVLMAIHEPAVAQEVDERTEQISIPYVPKDLSDPVRVRHLLMRIDAAALKACGDMGGLSIPTQEIIEWSDCHHESFARGVAAFHSPTLTRMADTIDPWIASTAQKH
ncbi:UrcA family protein [Acetobacter senegalensis]|uniref:UrcA family protein n=1 Tax=Acetobacter senegalensis TaxID=446692 RepID=UPI001EDBBB6D|nr:UrcA family protein [Acetobacter senegalensis]MCG4260987.1 UrcA family protein [Acetobacter senegalensis]